MVDMVDMVASVTELVTAAAMDMVGALTVQI